MSTARDKLVAELVRDCLAAGIAPEETGEGLDTGRIHRNGLRRGIVEWLRWYDLDSILVELPESESLCAPTGHGWWWARRRTSAQWEAVKVFVISDETATEKWTVLEVGDNHGYSLHHYNAWLPLAQPVKSKDTPK